MKSNRKTWCVGFSDTYRNDTDTNGIDDGIIELCSEVIKITAQDLRVKDLYLRTLLNIRNPNKQTLILIKATKKDIALLENFIKYSLFTSLINASGDDKIKIIRSGHLFSSHIPISESDFSTLSHESYMSDSTIPVRERIKRQRMDWGFDVKECAKILRISNSLYSIIEGGGVTHPKIAKRFKKLFGLSRSDYEELIPECRRKGKEEE
jgi:hypothetical protein